MNILRSLRLYLLCGVPLFTLSFNGGHPGVFSKRTPDRIDNARLQLSSPSNASLTRCSFFLFRFDRRNCAKPGHGSFPLSERVQNDFKHADIPYVSYSFLPTEKKNKAASKTYYTWKIFLSENSNKVTRNKTSQVEQWEKSY